MQGLLAGLRVLDLAGEPARMASRILSDLGLTAASANRSATADPDRPPARCRAPTAYAHGGPEAAFASLTALATGRSQRVDVSLQEVVLVSNMGAVGRFARSPFRGRRSG